ncbi:MAG TPA: hypothetical protein VIP28_01420 [Nocardioides sp.]
MRIRMTVTLPGTRNGQPWPDKGQSIDVPDDEAEQLIRYGAAEADPTDDDAPPPTARPRSRKN